MPCAAYGSYEEIFNNGHMFDILYISTPHSHHFQNCMCALNAGINVVCEKPLTVNSKQARLLYEVARSRNLFLMEAVWTRFFPLSIAVRDLITSNAIGEVLRVYVNNSTGVDVETLEPTHRYLNKDLAGGALLDIGVYALTWLFQCLYHTNEVAHRRAPSDLMSIVTLHEPSQTDQMVSMVMKFTRLNGREAHGIATASMILPDADDGAQDRSMAGGPTVHIYGLDGEVQVFGPAHRPQWIKVVPKVGKGKVRTIDFEIPAGGHGMFWEADAAARCVRDGKLECETVPWQESIHVMEVMDKIREGTHLVYPHELETTEYPVQLSLKRTN